MIKNGPGGSVNRTTKGATALVLTSVMDFV